MKLSRRRTMSHGATRTSYHVWIGVGTTLFMAYILFTQSSSADADTGHVHGRQHPVTHSHLPPQEIRARARAAVLGAFVADAASMPLHWIYDSNHLNSLVGNQDPAFFSPPSCPFYQYPLGELSPYGDEALPLLESLAKRNGLDPHGFSEDLFKAFSEYKGRLNGASKEFLENMKSGRTWPHCGASNNQAHSLVKVPAVVARYVGTVELEIKMEEAIRVHQNHDQAVHFGVTAAKILEKVVLGDSISSALIWAENNNQLSREAVSALKSSKHVQGRTLQDAVAGFGKTCHLPDSFQGPIYGLYSQTNYTQAVRNNIMAGGDSCSRGGFLAAMFAAQDGLGSIPEEWILQVRRYSDIENLVFQVSPA